MERHGTRVVIRSPGGYERLERESFRIPSPGAAQVRIAVAAIGVNYADCIVRMGYYASAKEYVGWPITPGFEVAGTVEAIGEDVSDVRVGDEVLAVTRFFGYASHVVVDRALLFSRPPSLAVARAAALPAVFMTAWFALSELAHPRPGHRILVHSAAGGVGSALVQLGKTMGCEITGVVGASHKVETVRALGAAHVIDKSRQDLWSTAARIAPGGFDVICDANGVSTLKASYAHLSRPGKLVVYGFHSMLKTAGGTPNLPRLALDWLRTPRFDPMAMTNESRSVLAFNLSYLFDRTEYLHEGMSAVMALLAEGRISAPAVVTYPLAEVGRAHRDLESGQTVGKLVLLP